MSLVKVFHPETDEMFEVPQLKADELILQHGWRQQPIDPNGVPAVVSSPIEENVQAEESEDEDEEAETGRRPRRS